VLIHTEKQDRHLEIPYQPKVKERWTKNRDYSSSFLRQKQLQMDQLSPGEFVMDLCCRGELGLALPFPDFSSLILCLLIYSDVNLAHKMRTSDGFLH
jgi:hypothetical protein